MNPKCLLRERVIKSQENKEIWFYVFAWVFGVLFVLTKGTLTNLTGAVFFDLDLVTVITAYIFLCYGPTRAGAYAFGQGFLIDLFSSGINGLFTLIYLCVFACIYLSCRLVNLHYPRVQIILVSLIVLLKEILVFGALIIFYRKIFPPGSFIGLWLASAAITGMMTPVLFHLFDRVRMVFLMANGKAPEEKT